MSQTSPRDVVITGIGIVSPLGIGRDAFWSSIVESRTGIKKSTLLSYVPTPGCIGGEIADFNDETAKKHHLKTKDLRKSLKVMCREIQLGVAAALQAMEDAGLAPKAVDPDRIGVDFGANLMSSPPEVLIAAAIKSLSERSGRPAFDFDKWGEQGMSGMEPLWLLRYLPNMPGCHIGIAIDARGPNNSITQDEASGGLAIGEAANHIRRNRADVMITGVTGTRLHAVKSCHNYHWDILADGPAESRVRPFDAHRTGEALSEASCVLILEAREHAEARGAKIMGTVLGCGASAVADREGTPDEATAVFNAARVAMHKAGISPQDLGHVNASASGHPTRDRYEAAGIRRILGDGADSVPVTAFKSYMGSTGSGAGLCEIAASLLAFQHGVIPKTLNFATPDPEEPLNVVHGEHLTTTNGLFLKTSVTRMGQASAVVIQA
ncbi:MAG TPA: beta-ketoacyl-[acyl-carrier-protein] synthase family protein [Planctomycetaceae bacterium]|nr:beta-ketoacyl-[acyl-carrier-protein] synthase family protein [Planctomycetaceae bacterium]